MAAGLRPERHLTARALLLAALAVSCADDGPIAPPTSFDPVSVTYTHHTAPEGCSTGWLSSPPCLLDYVVAGWEGTPAAGSSSYAFEIIDAVTPTSRGATLIAAYRETVRSTGHIVTESVPPCWKWHGPFFPDRRVTVTGRNIDCTFTYFTFESYAPRPVPELVAFERPDSISCQPYDECQGTFRIVVDIKGSGWYGQDETIIYVQNASGSSRWERHNAARAIDGTTIEFTFSELYYPGAGSTILLRYMPWGRNHTDDESWIELPFDAPSADLTLTAQPGQVDTTGQLVTFAAEAAGAVDFDVLGWRWVADDDTTAVVATQACQEYVNPCVTRVYESGSMVVTGQVDGRTQEANAHVINTEICPADQPWLSDPAVVAALQEGWDSSSPGGMDPGQMRERFGWLLKDPLGNYSVQWEFGWPSDVCGVDKTITGDVVFTYVVAIIHTHPGSGLQIIPSHCLVTNAITLPVTAGSGPSPQDTAVRNRIKRDLRDRAEYPPAWDPKGYILEATGLIVFDDSTTALPDLAVRYPQCTAWKGS